MCILIVSIFAESEEDNSMHKKIISNLELRRTRTILEINGGR